MGRSRLPGSFPRSTPGVLATLLALAGLTASVVMWPGGTGSVRKTRVAATEPIMPGPIWRLVAEDNFDGNQLNQADWAVYDSSGHAGNGRRTPAAVTVKNGVLRITGLPNGDTGGMAWMKGAAKYGRWAARVRMNRACATYHPVLLLWPTEGGGGTAPKNGGGELDWMEVIEGEDPNKPMGGMRDQFNFFLHYGSVNEDNVIRWNTKGGLPPKFPPKAIDLQEWHNIAVAWRPEFIRIWVDNQLWFETTETHAFPPGPMGQTIQLDWFPQDKNRTNPSIDCNQPAWMEIDWIRRREPIFVQY